MCGFTGILTAQAVDGQTLDRDVERMTRVLFHRGPDDSATWVDADAGVALGFRRLAILDLSPLGRQPMRSSSGRYTLVFNGEVFNHRELRRELEPLGWRFRGGSDTEVILAAFERWGVAGALPRFIGMFAIAVWDAELRRLSLIRDRFGIKPLFVHARPGLISFGSELKAIAADPGFDRTLHPGAVAAFLRYLYVPAPMTIFRGVHKLLPGHVLTLEDASAPLPRSVPFWTAEQAALDGWSNPFPGDEHEAVDELERLLVDAVERRMIADVPVGALLSGGVDSSVVTALMQRASARPVRTYSVGFDQSEHDESSHAAAVARHLGTDHTEVRLTGQDALDLVPRMPDIFDEPFADPSQLPTLLICGVARREVTVALTGDGGDEVFAGYNRYFHGERLLPRLARVPARARRLAAAAIRSVSPEGWDRVHRAGSPLLPSALRHRLPGTKLHKVARLLDCDSVSSMYATLFSAWPDPEGLVPGAERNGDQMRRIFDRAAAPSLLDRMMLADQVTYLADDLLAKVDRVSMAVSLEARVPLLDHRVAELAWRMPRSLKVRGSQGKWVLRQVLHRYVPQHLVDRPKVGFSVPIEPWLRGPLRAWAEELLSPSRLRQGEPLDAERIRRAWGEFQRGNGGSGLGLWSVLMFQAWKERWLP